jgi:hypothetical protein
MGVCATVATLAEAFARSIPLHTPHQKLQIELLKLMPFYKDMFNLVAWERAFMAALPEPDDESTTGLLIYEIFSFGRYNMYTTFNKEGAEHEYNSLVTELVRFGVKVLPHNGLDDW